MMTKKRLKREYRVQVFLHSSVIFARLFHKWQLRCQSLLGEQESSLIHCLLVPSTTAPSCQILNLLLQFFHHFRLYLEKCTSTCIVSSWRIVGHYTFTGHKRESVKKLPKIYSILNELRNVHSTLICIDWKTPRGFLFLLLDFLQVTERASFADRT